MEKKIRWLRPREYLQLVVNAIEAKKKREQKTEAYRRSKTRTSFIPSAMQMLEELKEGTPKEVESKSN